MRLLYLQDVATEHWVIEHHNIKDTTFCWNVRKELPCDVVPPSRKAKTSALYLLASNSRLDINQQNPTKKQLLASRWEMI